MSEKAGARSFELGGGSAIATVRRAHKAFAKRDAAALRKLLDPAVAFRPVDGLGLVGDTLHGVDEACSWFSEREESGQELTVWVRTVEELAPDLVLCVGVVSERRHPGRGYAATVAWVCTVRDGRIQTVTGFPSETAARRSLSAIH